jgi:hypothetical protein
VNPNNRDCFGTTVPISIVFLSFRASYHSPRQNRLAWTSRKLDCVFGGDRLDAASNNAVLPRFFESLCTSTFGTEL